MRLTAAQRRSLLGLLTEELRDMVRTAIAAGESPAAIADLLDARAQALELAGKLGGVGDDAERGGHDPLDHGQVPHAEE